MFIFKKWKILKIVEHEKYIHIRKVVEKLFNQMYLFLCTMLRTTVCIYLAQQHP